MVKGDPIGAVDAFSKDANVLPFLDPAAKIRSSPVLAINSLVPSLFNARPLAPKGGESQPSPKGRHV